MAKAKANPSSPAVRQVKKKDKTEQGENEPVKNPEDNYFSKAEHEAVVVNAEENAKKKGKSTEEFLTTTLCSACRPMRTVVADWPSLRTVVQNAFAQMHGTVSNKDAFTICYRTAYEYAQVVLCLQNDDMQSVERLAVFCTELAAKMQQQKEYVNTVLPDVYEPGDEVEDIVVRGLILRRICPETIIGMAGRYFRRELLHSERALYRMKEIKYLRGEAV